MFCVKCGNQMPDGSEFCPKCGTKVGGKTSKVSVSSVKDKLNKDEIKKYVKNNKKKSIIIGSVGGVVLLFILIAIVIAILNSGKAAAYDQGFKFVNDNNIKEAEESFQKAGDYADAPILYAACKAADQLYNNNNSGEAMTTILEMLDKNNNVDNLKTYKDRESSKLASFMVGEVYYYNNNLTDADNFYSLTPITYKVFNHSTYERRAIIALLGSWNVTHTVHFHNSSNGTTSTGISNITMIFNSDFSYSDSGSPWLSKSDGGTFCHNPKIGIWSVDLTFDGSDGSFHYIFDNNSDSKFSVKNGLYVYEYSGNEQSGSDKGSKC